MEKIKDSNLSELLRLQNSRIAKKMKTIKNMHEFGDLIYGKTLSSVLEINFREIIQWSEIIKKDNDWTKIRHLMAKILIRDYSIEDDFFKRPKDLGLDLNTLKTLPKDCRYYVIEDFGIENRNKKAYIELEINQHLLSELDVIIIDLGSSYYLRPDSKYELVGQSYLYFLKIYLDLLTHQDFVKNDQTHYYSVNINLFLAYQLNRNFKGRYRSFKENIEKLISRFPESRWIDALNGWLDYLEYKFNLNSIDIVENMPNLTFEEYPTHPIKRRPKDGKTSLNRTEISIMLFELLTDLNPALEKNKLFIAQIASSISGYTTKKHYSEMSGKMINPQEAKNIINTLQNLSKQIEKKYIA